LSAAANIEKLLKIVVVFVVSGNLDKTGLVKIIDAPRPKATLLGNLCHENHLLITMAQCLSAPIDTRRAAKAV
jgi:hypothetical protein